MIGTPITAKLHFCKSYTNYTLRNFIWTVCTWLSAYKLHGRAFAHASMIRVIVLSYERPSTLTTCNSKTPQPINITICTLDYIDQISESARNYLNWLSDRGFPHIVICETYNIHARVPLFYFLGFSRAAQKRHIAELRLMTQTTRNYPRMCFSGNLVKYNFC